MKDFYDSPISLLPFGLSDHVSIEAKPRRRSQFRQALKIKIKSRDLRPSNRLAMRSYLELVDVKDMVGSVQLCEEKVIYHVRIYCQNRYGIYYSLAI